MEIHIEYMKVKYMITKYLKDNFQIHDLNIIQKSIAEYGYRDPVILDEHADAIVSGNGRVEALYAMETLEYEIPILEKRMTRYGAGWKWLVPENIKVDEDGDWCLPVVRGTTSETYEEAVAFAVAANTAKKGNTLSRASTLDVNKLLDFNFGESSPITFTQNEIAFLSSLNNQEMASPDDYGKGDEERRQETPDRLILVLDDEEDIESVNEMLLEFVEEMGLSIKIQQKKGYKKTDDSAEDGYLEKKDTNEL